jgi:hypothetical protein
MSIVSCGHITTAWYDGKLFVPGTPGVYQRQEGRWTFWSNWTGEHWSVLSSSYVIAARNTHRGNHQDLPFRGIVSQLQEK